MNKLVRTVSRTVLFNGMEGTVSTQSSIAVSKSIFIPKPMKTTLIMISYIAKESRLVISIFKSIYSNFFEHLVDGKVNVLSFPNVENRAYMRLHSS